MKKTLLVFMLFFACSKGGVISEKIILNPKDIKTGYDSEATAIMNAMRFLGYEVDEAFVFGAGSGMDFYFFQSAFPFIGIKSDKMAENFFENTGIKWSGKQYTSYKKSIDIIKNKLKEGIPVILRVDVRFLPYRYGGKYGSKLSSYGRHYVTLFGIDFDKNLAYITDNESSNIIEISLNDLDKARNSTTQAFTPYGEFYWIEKERVDVPSYRKILLNSLEQVVKSYEKPVKKNMSELKNFYGIEAINNLSKEIVNIEKFVQIEMFLSGVFYSFYHYIEKLETKGAANREIFKDYLVFMNSKLKDKELEKIIKQINICAENWKILSSEFKEISSIITNYNEKYERKALYDRVGAIADSLAKEEDRLYKMIKDYIK
ncbi:MAG: BtrH N-terminal domain-containing protein [Brevinematales bacterium]|nr:BtrH N-terminal domain-containing protein [Brevinematales bacterium]